MAQVLYITYSSWESLYAVVDAAGRCLYSDSDRAACERFIARQDA